MRQYIYTSYTWQKNAKLAFALASFLIWLPIIWVVALFGLEFMSQWAQVSTFSYDFIFWSYVILSINVHGLIFGVMAYLFPAFYILPTWGLTLYSFYLSAQKTISYFVYINDLDKFYYFENGEDRYHAYTTIDIYLLILDIFFLIILFPPALFYMRHVCWKIRNWLKNIRKEY